MASFTYKELDKTLKAAGFKVKDVKGKGSHINYYHDLTSESQTIPCHAVISSGVAENVIQSAVYVASITGKNLFSKRSPLPSNVKLKAIEMHAKFKKNPFLFVPESTRSVKALTTKEQVRVYVRGLKEQVLKADKLKGQGK